MKHLKLMKSVIFLIGFGLEGIHAQQAIPASGGNASGSGGSSSYSVGQIVYTTNMGTGGSVLQGIQQPFEISVVTGLAETKGITLECSAFPNPTSDNLTLKIEGELNGQYIVYLFDVQGKLLETKNVEGNETSIGMKSLAPATYFLKIVQTRQTASPSSSQEIKTFKIIKN